jgi:pimeloyl-ACP methyl ester carboxylesterase
MAQGGESKIEVRGCNVHVRRGGSGAPLLYLHGASGTPMWLPFLDALSEKFDVIAPDHPTFGLSDEPDWLDDIHDMAYFYLDFMAALGLDGAHVVGQSLGGWIALEMAVRSTQRFRSLTLVGSAGIRIKGKPAADIFMMDPDELTRALLVDEAIIDRMINTELTEEQLDIQIRNKVSTARLGWQPRLFDPSLRKWMHRIDVPTHIVWGDTDRIIPPDYAKEFQGLIGGSSVTMIENSGHLPHVERTEPFVEAVAGFISDSAA